MAENRIIGRHVFADIRDVSAACLRDPERIMPVLRRALDEAGYHRLKELIHRFEGGGAGFTGVILLTESHAAVHTYPEKGYLALDVFGCGAGYPTQVVEDLVSELNGELCRCEEVERSMSRVSCCNPS